MPDVPVATTIAFGSSWGCGTPGCRHVAAIAALARPGEGLGRALANESRGGSPRADDRSGGQPGDRAALRHPGRWPLPSIRAGLMLSSWASRRARRPARRLHVHQHGTTMCARPLALSRPRRTAAARTRPTGTRTRSASRCVRFWSAACTASPAAPPWRSWSWRPCPRRFWAVSTGLLFGAGTTAGMMLMTWPRSPLVIARRALWLSGALRAAAGLGSLGVGITLRLAGRLAAGSSDNGGRGLLRRAPPPPRRCSRPGCRWRARSPGASGCL